MRPSYLEGGLVQNSEIFPLVEAEAVVELSLKSSDIVSVGGMGTHDGPTLKFEAEVKALEEVIDWVDKIHEVDDILRDFNLESAHLLDEGREAETVRDY